ncbi:2-oxoglutarate ferredoxin oxidoreductase subunit alpha, partial [Streptomyces sp. NPDC005566]
MTSQVSSPAGKTDEANEAVVGEQRAPQSDRPGAAEKEIRRLDRVIIRFAGDSGDGMQLTGDRFTSETAS